jgi:hypothetical protein
MWGMNNMPAGGRSSETFSPNRHKLHEQSSIDTYKIGSVLEEEDQI